MGSDSWFTGMVLSDVDSTILLAMATSHHVARLSAMLHLSELAPASNGLAKLDQNAFPVTHCYTAHHLVFLNPESYASEISF